MAFSDALGAYLQLLHGREPVQGGRARLEEILALATTLERGRERLWSGLDRNSDAAKALASFALKQYHALVNCMNALSIVFDQPGRVLFTGDAPPQVMAHIAAHPTNSFQGPYRLVKVPHHGTDRYYTPVLPQAEAYVVSNGGYQRRPVGRQFLDECLLRRPGCKIYCTNAHRPPAGASFCTYRDAEGGCAGFCHPISGKEQVLTI